MGRALIVWLLALLALLALATTARGFDDSAPGLDPFSDDEGSADADANVGMGMDPYSGYGGGDPYDPYASMEPQRPAVDLKTAADVESFLQQDDNEPAVLGYFDEHNQEDLETFRQLGGAMGASYRFGFVVDAALLASKKYTNCVLVYPPAKFVDPKGERARHRFPSKTIGSGQALEQFVVTKALPLVGLLNSASEARYLAVQLPVLTAFTAVDLHRNPKGFTYLANRLRKVAKSHKNVVFSIADLEEHRVEMEADFGLDTAAAGPLVGLRDGRTYYPMTAPFSAEAVEEFLLQFQQGSLTGRQKTAPATPAAEEGDSWEGSAVVPLDAASFEAEVFSGRDTFVDFYAPWCGHCQSLKPEYKHAAEHFRADGGVRFAALDATAHSVPLGFDVQGYPSLFFVPAGSRAPVAYEGAREASALIHFVEKHRASRQEL